MRGWVAMQMLGENVVGTVLEMGKHLRQQGAQPLPAGDAEGAVFFDILGTSWVSLALLPWSHKFPLMLAASLSRMIPREP